MKNQDIICISVSDWSGPWGSKQHLMARLARDNRVLYVEPLGSFFDFIKYPKFFFSRLFSFNRLRETAENVQVYTPAPVLPFGSYFIFINNINQSILCFNLRMLISRLKFRNPILWLYTPASANLIGKLKEGFVVYHCAADFTSEKKSLLRKRALGQLQTYLIKKAQIVLTLTNGLSESFEKLNKNTFYFPSAVDLEYFEKIRTGHTVEPADLSAIKRPRLGIAGYLDGKILDVGLLDGMAKENPGWSIVMIGPFFRNKQSLVKLKRNKNIYFLGWKHYSEVALYLKYIDICLIPYVRNEFTNSISSIKLYEYLAMGKPVVSTSFSSELNKFKDVIAVADNREQFCNNIYNYLNNKNAGNQPQKRIEFVLEDSWAKRLEFLDQKIKESVSI